MSTLTSRNDKCGYSYWNICEFYLVGCQWYKTNMLDKSKIYNVSQRRLLIESITSECNLYLYLYLCWLSSVELLQSIFTRWVLFITVYLSRVRNSCHFFIQASANCGSCLIAGGWNEFTTRDWDEYCFILASKNMYWVFEDSRFLA